MENYLEDNWTIRQIVKTYEASRLSPNETKELFKRLKADKKSIKRIL